MCFIANEQHRTLPADSPGCPVRLMSSLSEHDRPEANEYVEQHSDRTQKDPGDCCHRNERMDFMESNDHVARENTDIMMLRASPDMWPCFLRCRQCKRCFGGSTGRNLKHTVSKLYTLGTGFQHDRSWD